MKITQVAYLAIGIGAAFADVASAMSIRSLFKRGETALGVDAAEEPQLDAASAARDEDLDEEAGRKLVWCESEGEVLEEKWHPQYSEGWANGRCRLGKDCNSPGYSSELACCKGAYAGQITGHCLNQLPSPPTSSPTGTGGLDVYYPDYETAWQDAYCINDRPLPNGRPTYDTMLACCKGAYGGQMSGKCLSMLPAPPTSSPTETGGLDVYYPDYETAWPDAYCINDRPLPSGRPSYDTMLACCKGSYGGQMSGKCLSMLPEPPTTSPTSEGGADFWYPVYEVTWSEAGCSNSRPLPFNLGDRPTYNTQLACCKGAYGGQASGKCLSELPSPPTISPTMEGGVGDVWYPDYDTPWSVATCKNDVPHPFTPGSRPTYSTQLACCKGAYGGQASGMCLAALPSPPTASPTSAGGLDVYYPDYTLPWSEGVCINDRPLPNGRPSYDTMLACCKGAYGGQATGRCLSGLESPPTQSPTNSGGLEVYYPNYAASFADGVCINDRPLPNGRRSFSSKELCCRASYSSQTSQKCMCDVNVCYSCRCGGDQSGCSNLDCEDE